MVEPTDRQREAYEKLQKIDSDLEVRWSPKTGTPVRLTGRLTIAKPGSPEVIAKDFIDENKDLFVLKDSSKDLQLTRVGVGKRGSRHVKFQQMYSGVPVFGKELVVHLTGNNVVKRVNGEFVPDIDLPVEPEVSYEKAIEIVLGHDKGNQRRSDHGPLLMVLIREEKPHLVWHLTVDGFDKDLRGNRMSALWEYFVDALTGEVVWRYNNEQTHGSTSGSGSGLYAGNVALNTYHNHTDSVYQLDDRSNITVGRIYTHDAANNWPPQPLSEDNNNDWDAAGQRQEVDCHFYTRTVFDYFFAVHGRNGFDDAGADIIIYADVAWDNSSWNGNFVKVGNGGPGGNPQCALDVIAHEWTHAVTQHEANLIYDGESGALNESFSDVFACLIDGGWLYGEDYWTGAAAPAARNLEDPTNGGQYDPADPITSVLAGHQPDHTDDQYNGWQDYGGVHINSGIMNKAAHLIATGGTHRGINICEGLGRDRLGELYYEVLTGGYLTSSSDFADMRDAVLDALETLYLGNFRYNRWRVSVINAFAAVGVGTAVACPVICFLAPVEVAPIEWIECVVAPAPVCAVAPTVICEIAPISECAIAPVMACAVAPTARVACLPSPAITACATAPIAGCLPGPDPLPFNPVFKKVIDIGEEFQEKI